MWTKFLEVSVFDFKEANMPYDDASKRKKNTGRSISQLENASVVKCLMYAMHCTRLNIAFSFCKLSRYTVNPSVEN